MGALVYNRPSFLNQIRNRSHAVIEASAGTGKTFAIEHLIIDLLLSGVYAIDRILVVTFTEKATAELRVRIRQALEKILFGIPNPDPAGKTQAVIIDEQARKRLEDAFHAFDRAPIFTIHGFCHRVLTEFAFQSGMLMELQLIDRSGAFHQAFRDELRDHLATDSVTKPLLQAWLTGADAEDGKGKTPDDLEELLLEAYWRRYLDSPGCDARKEAARRLMDSDDKEFLKRAWRRSGLDGEPLGNAFKSIERLERAIEQADRDPGKLLEELGTIDFDALTAPILKPRNKVNFSARAGKLAFDLQAAAAVAQCREWKLVDLFLPPIARRMDRDKREHGLIDYDDMLAWVWRALQAPDGAALAESLRARFGCALVDEFQDTDDLQWQIFRRLFVEGKAGNRLYVVGDPKQAIYSFRGADIYTYLAARDELIKGGAAQMPLLDNFRSTSDLIDACNHIFDQAAPKAIFDRDRIKYDKPVRCGRPDRTALDKAGKPITPVILMRYQRADGEKAPVSEVRRAIGQHMAAELYRMLYREESRIKIEEQGAEPRYVKPKNIYVLTRTRMESAEAGEYLREAGVPFAFYKQEGLFQTSEAYYILDILRAVAEPHVRSRRLKAWLSPFFAVPLRDVALIEEVPSAHPLNERLYEWKEIAERGQFAELFDRLLHQSGLVNRELFLTGNERGLTNYQHIFEILLSAALTRRIGLAEITALLEDYINGRAMPDIEEGNLQRLESERDAVSVITVHMSKGLEADVVVLFGGFGRINDQRPVVVYHDDSRRRFAIGKKAKEPIKDKLNAEQQGEDRRLLYVGLTRARVRLYLPLLPEGCTKQKIGGYYAALNDRLCAIEAGARRRAISKLFAVQNVAEPADTSAKTGKMSDLIKAWRPPGALLDAVKPAYSEGSFWNLRRTHGPLIMRSYTALQGAREEQVWDIPAEEFKRDMETSAAEPDLPGGREAGIFLHEVIERLAMESIAQSSGLDRWREREDVKALFYSAMRRNQVKNQSAWFERGTQMVFDALTVPIPISGGRTVAPLYRCASVREMEFVYPIPESNHPLLAKGAARGLWIVERGYLKGFVDFIFEHEGLVYFADWKSDHLSSYEPDAIQKHVKLHYAIQAQIYSIGIIRLLQIRSEDDYERRFGGLLYIFLRGIDRDGQRGVYFHRPTWTEICAYETELMRMETEPAPDHE